MNNTINNQAKDEVRGLLNELVVTPVSSDFGEKLKELKENISKLSSAIDEISTLQGQIVQLRSYTQTINDSLNEVAESVSGCETNSNVIKQKTKDINIKFDGVDKKLQEVADSVSDCQTNCNEIKQKTKEVDEKLVRADKTLQVVADNVSGCQTNCNEIKQKTKEVDEKLVRADKTLQVVADNVSGCQTNCNEIKQKTKEVDERISRVTEELLKLNDISKVLESVDIKIDQLSLLLNSNEKFNLIEKKLSTQIQNASQGMDNRFHEKSQEISEYHIRQYKLNKVSFLLIIIISLINLLGLIGVVMMQYIY